MFCLAKSGGLSYDPFMKTRIPFTNYIRRSVARPALLFLIVCFAISPIAQAVVPPPDGGYPGFNTAEGTKALFSLTTGAANTAVGWFSLSSNTDGSFNTALGAGTLLFNIGNQDAGDGVENTAIGTAALLFNTTGSDNTAVGTQALLSNTIGTYNTADGAFALFSNTTGSVNTANGNQALFRNTTGGSNTAIGNVALYGNTTGSNNTAIGRSALQTNTTGDSNTASGFSALAQNTTGNNNTANGFQALYSNTIAGLNTAIGYQALLNNNGAGNTALGYLAGSNLTTGDDNICIGNVGVAGDGGTIRIGESFIGATFIAGIFGQTSSGGTGIVINSAGKLGTTTSSRRFKDNIKPMNKASEALFALKPVSFRYKKEIDPEGTSQFGLVAEEVEAVNPDLVVRDKERKTYSVRYDQVNAMLLNEFLKEHKRVQEQQATISQLKQDLQATAARQQKQIEALTADLQKVSAQLETSKPATQTVLNNQ